MYKVVSIEPFDDEYVVYVATSPNWKMGVFRGSLDDAERIALAYVDAGYRAIGNTLLGVND